jgi:molecular chaperone GrpE
MANQDEKDLHEQAENQHESNSGNQAEESEVNEQGEDAAVTSEKTPEALVAELNDKYLRLYSDFDNYRKRTMKEKAELIMSASSGVMKDLLPVLDDFERAIVSNQKVEDATALKEGFQLIYNKFKNTLHAKGLKPMESKGENFDLDLHEAITNIPVEDEAMKGKVIDEVEKGYYLNEKVLRYAKVVVGQ